MAGDDTPWETEAAIRRLLAEYCQYLDDGRFDDWIDLFATEVGLVVSIPGVVGMSWLSRRAQVLQEEIRLAALQNDIPYFFAVTAVNLSGNERTLVTTVTAVPVGDTAGPAVDSLQIGGVPLTDGMLVARPAEISLNASDESGMSRVEFSVEPQLQRRAPPHSVQQPHALGNPPAGLSHSRHRGC